MPQFPPSEELPSKRTESKPRPTHASLQDPQESLSTWSTQAGGGIGLGAARCVMTHGGGGGVCVRERPPIKVECLAPGAVGRERAPAPSRAAAPAALCRAPLPVSPRGKALGFSLIPLPDRGHR